MRDDGLALYRCELCDEVYEAYIETEPTEPEPTEPPVEEPQDPAECEHRWECYGEGETGMFLYECMDCGAMYVEYVCPHELCIKDQLTNPEDGTVYTQNTCLSCGYTFAS